MKPIFWQKVSRGLDLITAINFGEFVHTFKPTVYYRIKTDDKYIYEYYNLYHYKDWNDMSFSFDEHRHDFEGVLVATPKKQTTKIRHIVACRSHYSINFDIQYGRPNFTIEDQGHSISVGVPNLDKMKDNYLAYTKYKLVDMESDSFLNNKEIIRRKIKPASLPEEWSDSLLERRFGKIIRGLYWKDPYNLFLYAEKVGRIDGV